MYGRLVGYFYDILHASADVQQDKGAWTVVADALVAINCLLEIASVRRQYRSAQRSSIQSLWRRAQALSSRKNPSSDRPAHSESSKFNTTRSVHLMRSMDSQDRSRFRRRTSILGDAVVRRGCGMDHVKVDDRLNTCMDSSDILRRSDWLKHWVLSVVQQTQTRTKDVQLGPRTDLSRASMHLV